METEVTELGFVDDTNNNSSQKGTEVQDPATEEKKESFRVTVEETMKTEETELGYVDDTNNNSSQKGTEVQDPVTEEKKESFRVSVEETMETEDTELGFVDDANNNSLNGTEDQFPATEEKRSSVSDEGPTGNFNVIENGNEEQTQQLSLKEELVSRRRCHVRNRLVLLVLSVVAVVSLLLPILVLVGQVKPLHCPCSTSKESSTAVSTKLLEDLQDLEGNVSKLLLVRRQQVIKSETLRRSINEISKDFKVVKETHEETRKNVVKELGHFKLKYNQVEEEIKDIDKMLSSAVLNSSEASTDGNQSYATNALWSAINSTSMELMGLTNIWFTVNASSKELQSVEQLIAGLNDEINNISKRPGPRGRQGYKGPQGPPGDQGSRGSNGPKGSNLTLCVYKKTSSRTTAGISAETDIPVVEAKGKKIISVHCDSNDARTSLLSVTTASDGQKTYTCECKKTSGSGDSSMSCYIHYWECPINTGR